MKQAPSPMPLTGSMVMPTALAPAMSLQKSSSVPSMKLTPAWMSGTSAGYWKAQEFGLSAELPAPTGLPTTPATSAWVSSVQGSVTFAAPPPPPPPLPVVAPIDATAPAPPALPLLDVAAGEPPAEQP